MTQCLEEKKAIVSQLRSIKKLTEGLTGSDSVRSLQFMLELSHEVEKLTSSISDTLRQQRLLNATRHLKTLLNNGTHVEHITIDGVYFFVSEGEIGHVSDEYGDLPIPAAA